MGFRAIHAVVLLAIILVSAWVRADEATWNVIPLELVERMAWPSFDPLATWPAPGALTDVEKASPEKRPDPRDVEDLLWAARLVVRKSWLPEEPQKSLAVDDRGRLFLKLQQGSETGLASMHMYRGSGLPHTPFAMVVRSAQPDPSTVGELRERVSRYVDPNLAQELQGGESQLHAHPRYPFAANAYLSPSGPSQMGLHFQVIHAYAHGGYALIVLY